MAAIEALRTALGALKRNPVLFAGAFVYALVILPQTALQLLGIPILPLLLQAVTFFVTPFLLAGVIGMAAESLDGSTSLGTFWERGRDRYVPLLLGNLVHAGIFIAFGIVTFLLALVFLFAIGFGAVAAGGGLGESLRLGVLLLGLVVFGLVFLALVAIGFVIQFYPIAIVVEGADVVEGYKRSARVVRDNLVSALGYWIASFVVGALIVLPVAGALIFWMVARLGASVASGGVVAPVAGPVPGFMMSGLPLVGILLFSVAGVVLMVVLTAFQQTYATAFYARVSEFSPAPNDSEQL
jgi:hypothetical protein